MIQNETSCHVQMTSPLRLSTGFFLCGLALIFAATAARATTQNESAVSAPIATLRVQTNLVQIPVLVLDQFQGRLHAAIAPNRFVIRLGGGPWVRPKYVRLEGEDPIDLAIVIDPRGTQQDLLAKLSESIAGLSTSSLSSRDRVSIYMMGCSVMHIAKDIPVDSEALRNAAETVLDKWKNHVGEESQERCKPGTQLWDTLAYVTRAMSGEPGRRTMLAITNGDDQRSVHTPAEVINLARSQGISIFALETSGGGFGSTPEQDALSLVTESSGGIALKPGPISASIQLKNLVQMLRDRYIVEFPRPLSMAGKIDFDVRVAGANFFIRSASKSVPLPNPVEAGNNSITVANTQPSPADINSPQMPAAISEATLPQISQPQAVDQPQAAASVTASIAAPTSQKSQAIATTTQPASAPTNADSNLPVPTLRVASKLTIEDVTVTDAKRTPVHGLMKSEFELREDGKPQQIRNFEEFQGGKPSERAVSPTLAPDTYTNVVPAAPSEGAVNILMLDSITTGIAHRLAIPVETYQYERQQAMNYLKSLPSGTAVAVLQMGSGVHVIQELTQDKTLLLAAMSAASYKPVPGTYLVQRDDGETCSAANAQSRLVVDDLDQVAAYLAGIKGKKNVIWFTPGTPWLTQYPQFASVLCRMGDSTFMDYTAQLDKAYGLLNSAQVALYPIDPRGLDADAPAPGEDVGAIAARAAGAPPTPASVKAQRAAGAESIPVMDHGSLEAMAEATGGRAYFNRNDLDAAVHEAIATGANYYSLAYVPPVSGYDGKFHTISVKVSRPSLMLNYRPGYTSLNPARDPSVAGGKAAGSAAPAQDNFEGTMRHGTVNSTELQFDVHVAPSGAARKPGDPQVIGSLSKSLAGKHLVRYDFMYNFTGDEITLVDNTDGTKTGSVEFLLAAYDAEGELLNTVGQTSKFTVKPENVTGFMKRQIQMPVQFDLPPGNVFVRVGVEDVSSQKTGTLEIPETVAK